jgi:hypothetical protein
MELPDKDALGGELYKAVALYYHGGTPENKLIAKSKLVGLAASGDLETDLRLAVIELGEFDMRGVSRLRELAAKGYMPAFYELGNVYYFGFGDLGDKEKGLSYWRRAAELGHLYSKLNFLKIVSQNATFPVRVMNVFKIWSLMPRLFYLTLRRKNDQRILGVTPSY